jgi:hypothetical protein
MKKEKCLISIFGESYRLGPQTSRDRSPCEKSISFQDKAITSHLEFCSFLKNTFNVDVEVILNIYTMTPELDTRIYEHYSNHPDVSYTHLNILYSGPIGEYNLLINTVGHVSQIITYNYIFVFFTRIDVFLKKYLHTIFDLREKIRFAHLNELGKIHNSFNVGFNVHAIGTVQNDVVIEPHVNHFIVYVPRKFFSLIYENKLFHSFLHGSYNELCKIISKDDLDFFLYTSHSSSSDICWNPIFHQVGRFENKSWACKNIVFKMPDLQIIYQDPFTDYDNLSSYDFSST